MTNGIRNDFSIPAIPGKRKVESTSVEEFSEVEEFSDITDVDKARASDSKMLSTADKVVRYMAYFSIAVLGITGVGTIFAYLLYKELQKFEADRFDKYQKKHGDATYYTDFAVKKRKGLISKNRVNSKPYGTKIDDAVQKRKEIIEKNERDTKRENAELKIENMKAPCEDEVLPIRELREFRTQQRNLEERERKVKEMYEKTKKISEMSGNEELKEYYRNKKITL